MYIYIASLCSCITYIEQSLISHRAEIMTSQLSTIAISLILMILTILLWLWSKLPNSKPPLPPGPLSLPIVGYLPFLDRNLHTHFTTMAQTYGPIFKVRAGSILLVVINTPELAKEVVRDQDDIFSNRPVTIVASLTTYGGQDIVWSKNSPSWRKLRKLLVQEVLSNKNLEASSCFRRDEVRKTIKDVYGKMGTPINLNEISFSTEANVLTRMIWDNEEENDHSERGAALRMAVSKLSEIFLRPNVSDFIPSLAWLDLQGIEREVRREFKKLEGIITSIIDDRIRCNSKSNSNDEAAGKKDFLQILLDQLKDQKDSTSLDLPKIKMLLIDMLSAGTETTASLIEWTMAEVMQNHNIMKKIQEELAEIVGPTNVVEESHLSKLKYLDATIKETLRLHPVVPLLLARSPSQTCTVGGYTIPKDSTVFINAWAIHRDPRYWENPLEFNPERFMAREGMDKYDFKGNNLKFFPFGSGRRLCPGIPLAEKMQMYILASFLHSFNWSLPEGEEHDFSNSFAVALKKRKPLVAIPSQRLPDTSLYM